MADRWSKCDDYSKIKCCCEGPEGRRGPAGPEGPAGRLSTDYLQVYDPNLTNIFTEESLIQLALNSGDLFEEGGFTLTSTQVPNDTINFPETGVYLINAQFIYSFLPDAAVASTGDVYVLNIDVVTNPLIFLPQILLDHTIGIPGGGAVDIGGTESFNFILNVTTIPFTLSFELEAFSYAFATDGELNLSLAAIDIVQLDDEPIT